MTHLLLCLLLAQLPATDAQLAPSVLRLFEQSCAECHGPQVPRPKGKFGYVTDLSRIARNRKMVIPGKPEDSELLRLIEEGEMPPPKSKRPRIAPDQIDLVRRWILAGAPADQASSEQPPTTLSFTDRLLSWLGRLHPATVHFPIAFLIGAALIEAAMACFKRMELSQTVRWCIWMGAIGAIIAAGLGWVHAEYAGFAPSTILNHRVAGVATAVWGLALVYAAQRQHRRNSADRRILRAMLVVGMLLAGFTGYFGGLITYGMEHYRW